eukprot:537775_1
MAGCSLDKWLVILDYLEYVLSLTLRTVFDILFLLTNPIWYLIEAYQTKYTTLNRKTFNTILITGASSGIGQGVAIEFAKRSSTHSNSDLTLFLLGRNMNRLKKTQQKCLQYNSQINIYCHSVDIRNKKQLRNILIEECDTHKPIDLVFANVGINSAECSTWDWFDHFDEIVNVNVIGTFNTISPLLKRFIKRKHGHIAFNASLSSYNTMFGRNSIYTASKAFIRFLCAIIRCSVMYYNIDCTVINLGFIDTPMNGDNVAKLCKSVETTSEVIVNGLCRNKVTIDYPFHFSFIMWYIGSLHPILYSCISCIFKPDKEQCDTTFVDYLKSDDENNKKSD